jgi:hypothetical protein
MERCVWRLVALQGDPAETVPFRSRTAPSYSAAARKALTLSAVAVTLLPIPVTYFKILPAYPLHARFLLIYSPFVCLLTLSYLFYVRDSLARAMFADVLDPQAPPDSYYHPSSERLGRWFRRVKAITLGILPALMVMTSMYCVSRYVAVFNQSVARAAEAYVERADTQAYVDRADTVEVQLTPRQQRAKRPRAAGRSGSQPAQPDTAAADTLPNPSDSTAVRQYVIRASGLESTPRVVELTALYIGAFVALLVAVTLMALKEYAKEAMGLSEHELMFGRYLQSDEQH